MSSFQNIILFITILFSGMVAGLLYSYSCSVNPGLKALSSKEYLSAMQSINRAIQNPVFFVTFMGLLILLPLCCWLAYKHQINISFPFLATATLIYFIGVIGVTAAGNIPLNNQLESFNINTASDADMLSMRTQFEIAWVRWHSIRTTASVISFAVLLYGVFKKLIA